MNEITQRLKIIKNAIMLEEKDIIELQVVKLSQLNSLEPETKNILRLLERGSFETVISLIEAYSQSNNALVSYDDKEMYGLRLELNIVGAEYEELSIQKISIESLLNDFNNQYYHQCGKLIELILSYRARLKKEQALNNPEDQNKTEAFEEAQKDYDDFHREYEEKSTLPIVELNHIDQTELKAAYRKASTLCHPDKVSEEFKDQAGVIFKQLNEAYKAKDLKAVKEILATLLSQNGFSSYSDTVGDIEKLRLRIIELKEKIAIIKVDITTIKGDESYQVIEAISDWDDYFAEMKISLKNELMKLEKKLKEAD